MNDTKLCPYCGGEIKAIAKKCKHCGKWLVASEVHHENVNKPLPNTNVSILQVERNVEHSTEQGSDEVNNLVQPSKNSSNIRPIIYIASSIVVILLIVVIALFIPKGSSNNTSNTSDFESGLILNDKGDSIAAAIASADYVEGGTALSKSGREKRAKELMNDRYSNDLSEGARKLITNERFNQVYLEYYVNYDYYEMGTPEYRFKSVWYIFPQLDLYRIIENRKDKQSPIRLKNYQAQYNKTMKAFIQDAEKKGWDSDKINSLLMIELPDFATQCARINNLSDEDFREVPTEYGEWSLSGMYFTTYLRGEDEKAQIGVQLRPGAILFSCYDLDEAPDGVNIELSESPYDNAYEIYTIPDENNFKITSEKDINRFLDACEKGQHMKFLFLLEGATHWGWYDFDLKKLKGAKAAYNATNQ